LVLKEWPEAAGTFAAAVKRYPNEAQLWFDLGLAQENLRDLKNAAASYEQSVKLKPEAETYGNLSNTYCRLARFAEAEAMARRALDLGAPRAQALNSLGLALNRQNKFAEAKAAFEKALQLEPNDSFILSNLANLAVDQLDFPQAWEFFARARKASKDAPLIRHHEAMARLLAGDYAIGWRLYEARLELPNALRLRLRPRTPRYNGEPLAGEKMLLVAEQGFGDAIHFCRYGTLLEKAGMELIWVAPKPLHRLFAANLPGRVIAEGETLPAADYYLPIVSLPLALGLLEPEEAPIAPYLRAPSPFIPLPEGKGKANSKIGLVWSGSKTHERDFERSIPLEKFAPLWKKIPAQFYAPFTGAGLEQIAGQPVTRLDHLINDFADTAGLLSQLDYLITVDTAAAHLAGALGVKTFLLLPYAPDWRWSRQGETTRWYPTVTLLRQSKPGDWDGVIAQLIESLSAQV